jgi:pilus assembly protein CpaC
VLPGDESRSPDDFELFLEGILEAPRGPRDVFPCKHYVPAYKNGPTSEMFPCAGKGGCGGGCAAGGCAGGCVGGGPAASLAPPPLAPAAAAAPAEDGPPAERVVRPAAAPGDN